MECPPAVHVMASWKTKSDNKSIAPVAVDDNLKLPKCSKLEYSIRVSRISVAIVCVHYVPGGCVWSLSYLSRWSWLVSAPLLAASYSQQVETILTEHLVLQLVCPRLSADVTSICFHGPIPVIQGGIYSVHVDIGILRYSSFSFF